jgi:hypothetical protein
MFKNFQYTYVSIYGSRLIMVQHNDQHDAHEWSMSNSLYLQSDLDLATSIDLCFPL